MLVLMFLRFAFYVGLDIMSASLLMTFAVKGLGWTKPQGIAVTSCFRGVYSAGRFASVLLAFRISPTKMIFLDLILILTGLIVLTVFIQFHHLILWIFISLAGFGMGSFFGASMSWADKYLNVSGKTGSVLITGLWLGLLALPALTGYLFDNVSPFLLYLFLLWRCNSFGHGHGFGNGNGTLLSQKVSEERLVVCIFMAVFWRLFLWTSVLCKLNHCKNQKRSLTWQLTHYFSLLKLQTCVYVLTF